jgi:hypothetical protein
MSPIMDNHAVFLSHIWPIFIYDKQLYNDNDTIESTDADKFGRLRFLTYPYTDPYYHVDHVNMHRDL